MPTWSATERGPLPGSPSPPRPPGSLVERPGARAEPFPFPASVKRMEAGAGSEAPLQRDLRPSQVLGVGGLAFPSQPGGAGPAADFFRRYGTLCLLARRDPYPGPLAEAQA